METHDILCHAPTDGLGEGEVDHELVLGVESRPEPGWLQQLFLLKSDLEVRRARSRDASGARFSTVVVPRYVPRYVYTVTKRTWNLERVTNLAPERAEARGGRKALAAF
jgi:hypothetical protein